MTITLAVFETEDVRKNYRVHRSMCCSIKMGAGYPLKFEAGGGNDDCCKQDLEEL